MDRRTFKFLFVKGPLHNLHKTPSAVVSQPNFFFQANVIVPHKCVSSDSNRRRKRRPRTVIVRGRAFTGLLLSAASFKKIFLPLQITVTVRGRTSRGLLLSADVPATDYYCPRTYLPRTITVRGRTCSGLLQPCAEGRNRPKLQALYLLSSSSFSFSFNIF